MIPRKPEPLSQEEIEVLNLENRRVSAEGALQSASEAKKRIEADMEVLNSKIEEGKIIIQKNLTDIETTNKLVVDAQDSYVEEKGKLDTLLQSKKELEQDLETFKLETEKKKQSFTASMTDSMNALVKTKTALEQEIKYLNDSKTPILSEIDSINKRLESLRLEQRNTESKTFDLNVEYTALSNRKVSLEIETKKLEDTISNQNSKIESTTSTLSDMSKEISDKDIEIETINKSIEKKTEEYKAIENQAFIILNKQQLLDNKEAFIKNQYARAGVKWEE